MTEDKIKQILPDIFSEHLKRFPFLQVYYAYDNYLINKNLLDDKYVEEALQNNNEIDYTNIYYHKKPSKRGIRKIYAISLRNQYYLGFLIMQYCFEVNVDFVNAIDITEPVFIYKRNYGFDDSNNSDLVVRDVKNFYFVSNIDLFFKVLPKDEKGFFNEIIRCYEKLYLRAGENFGLLQNSWHSWILADMYLLQIDKDIASKGIEFYREGDAYYFSKDKTTKKEFEEIDVVFEKYKMQYRESFIYVNKNYFRKCISFIYEIKEKILLKMFPVRKYIKIIMNKRFAIHSMINDKYIERINEKKLIRLMLRKTEWDDFELYHIINKVIKSKIDIAYFYLSLIDRYSDSSWFLRSQILMFFLINKEEDVLQNILNHNNHTRIEKEEFKKLCDAMQYDLMF